MRTNNKFSVIIAEDEYRIRDNLAKKIPSINPLFFIAGTAVNGKQALDMIIEKAPNLLITDIKMPVMDGLELIEELYLTHPDLPVVILSGYDDFSYAKKAIHFGVKDYILKPSSREELTSLLSRMEILLSGNQETLCQSEYIYNSETAVSELCTQLTEFLKNNFTENIAISELAENFKINPTYMSRIFKQNTGRTPSRYLTELRINRAKRLLTDSDELEIKEISINLGFEDQGYFSRLFKKETGTSPAEFRKKQNLI